MRVLVCGDRDWSSWRIIAETIGMIEPDVIIQGEAKGADIISATLGESAGIPVERYPANWGKYGRAAGPIRNKQMLEEGKPDLVVAFHNDIANSRGTGNMLTLAEDAGIPYCLVWK